MLTRTTLKLAAVAALSVPALAMPAQAQTVADADTVGDMATYDDDDVAVPAPERTLNDVSNVTLSHRARRVAVQVDYTDLRRKAGGEYQSLFIAMVTDEGARRYVSLDAWRRHWSGETWMFTGRGRTVECAMRHSVDYEANVMSVGFSRRCASDPQWVRFRVVAASQGQGGMFVDDALSDVPIESQDFRDLERSDRVHRETTG